MWDLKLFKQYIYIHVTKTNAYTFWNIYPLSHLCSYQREYYRRQLLQNNIYGQQDKSLNDTLSKARTHVRRPLPSDLKQRSSFVLRRTIIARTPEATLTYPNNLPTSVQLTHTETRVIPRVPRHVPRRKFL